MSDTADGPRINVIGNCGSGKTTLTRLLASKLHLEPIELDFYSHGPNWSETPRDEFTKLIETMAREEKWIVDGNYSRWARPPLWNRATHVIWLDFPRCRIMLRLLRRSTYRAVSRKPLWHGNKETFLRWFDRGHPMRWAFSNHARKREQVLSAFNDPSTAHFQKTVLSSPKEVKEFLRKAH